MSNIDLTNTKQSKQIAQLRICLEQSGWTITNEIERELKGKPRWEVNDETPNLIYSWSILRNPIYSPIWLDFIAWWDYKTYETHVNDCLHCQIRETEIRLGFNKDKSLQRDSVIRDWKGRLENFLDQLNEIEKNKSI